MRDREPSRRFRFGDNSTRQLDVARQQDLTTHAPVELQRPKTLAVLRSGRLLLDDLRSNRLKSQRRPRRFGQSDLNRSHAAPFHFNHRLKKRVRRLRIDSPKHHRLRRETARLASHLQLPAVARVLRLKPQPFVISLERDRVEATQIECREVQIVIAAHDECPFGEARLRQEQFRQIDRDWLSLDRPTGNIASERQLHRATRFGGDGRIEQDAKLVDSRVLRQHLPLERLVIARCTQDRPVGGDLQVQLEQRCEMRLDRDGRLQVETRRVDIQHRRDSRLNLTLLRLCRQSQQEVRLPRIEPQKLGRVQLRHLVGHVGGRLRSLRRPPHAVGLFDAQSHSCRMLYQHLTDV